MTQMFYYEIIACHGAAKVSCHKSFVLYGNCIYIFVFTAIIVSVQHSKQLLILICLAMPFFSQAVFVWRSPDTGLIIMHTS